jgi:hypothetical protein
MHSAGSLIVWHACYWSCVYLCIYRFLICFAGRKFAFRDTCLFYLKGWDEMGFNFSFGKKKKIGKSIRTYVADRVKEKRSFEKQLERLEAQLQNETVDQDTYERFRDVLEINFVKQREEALERFTLF